MLGNLATVCFINLNWVLSGLIGICGPISILSNSGKCEPITSSLAIEFFTNGDWDLMTPQSQHLALPCTHELVCARATYSFLIPVQYLCNASMLDLYQGTHPSP